MKIIYRNGDLFKTDAPFIAHQVNCQGAMGSGIAKIVKQRYPSAYEDYILYLRDEDYPLGGTLFSYLENRTIVHLFAQYRYGYDNKRYTNYDALEMCLNSMNTQLAVAASKGEVQVAMPKIGCGLGGGDWRFVSRLIEVTSTNYQPIVYEL